MLTAAQQEKKLLGFVQYLVCHFETTQGKRMGSKGKILSDSFKLAADCKMKIFNAFSKGKVVHTLAVVFIP